MRRAFAPAFLICLVFLVAALGGCQRIAPDERDPVSAANGFFASLESGKPREAYDNAAFGFQAEQTYDAFLSNARGLGLMGGQPPVWTEKKIGDREAHLAGSAVNEVGQPIQLSVAVTADGKAWKVFALETGGEAGGRENHFTLVGRDTGFNDVYHQPMPSPAQRDALVRSTMVAFSKAVASNNFHAFYLGLSQQWREGERVTGAESNGVTENMLKNHFSGFVEKKIDISGVTGLTPVYDSVPRINDDGLLDLQGHFPTRPYQLNFDLQYIYELPWWKLFGINVSLTQQ